MTTLSPDVQARIQALGLLDPTDRRDLQRQPAPPLESLQGKRGGFLDNRKGNADALLERTRDLLVGRCGVVDGGVRAKWVFSTPAGPEIIEDLAQSCDFVVTAVGD